MRDDEYCVLVWETTKILKIFPPLAIYAELGAILGLGARTRWVEICEGVKCHGERASSTALNTLWRTSYLVSCPCRGDSVPELTSRTRWFTGAPFLFELEETGSWPFIKSGDDLSAPVTARHPLRHLPRTLHLRLITPARV